MAAYSHRQIYNRNFKILDDFYIWAGWFESSWIKTIDRFSCDKVENFRFLFRIQML